MIALAAVLALSPLSAVAANSAPQSVPMKKVKYERHKQDTDIDGRRSPAKPVMCVISEDGVAMDIPDEVETYEIWDTEGSVCIAVYADGQEFADHLFSVAREYSFVFTTADYYYIGYISTL